MPSAHLAVVSGLPFQVFGVELGVAIAGRLPEVDLALNHLEISRRHCQFSWNGAVCSVEDLKSRWGTKVNNVRIATRTELKPGDRISIGPVTLLFGIGELPAEADLKSVGFVSGPDDSHVPVLVAGREVGQITLTDRLTLGRDEDANVVLQAAAVSRHHASIERTPTGFRVSDLRSSAGSFVNGHRFDEHDLTIGDRLQIGPFVFQFDGRHLNPVSKIAGGSLRAVEVSRGPANAPILDQVTLSIAPGRFAGIIGPSGAGKSSLLDALSGMREPTGGRVFIDDADIYATEQTSAFGYVPQDDIVHRELTVSEALTFAARLRLPRDTPPVEIQKLIIQTMQQLGIIERASTPIVRLSGGQRKRVSVGVELLAKPSILFLDEPTSGLDPATEFKLMELLRDLTDTGCTIVCTTHVMENLYLVDQLAVMFGGCLVFSGSPQETRDHFGVQRLGTLYDLLAERSAHEWRELAPPAGGEKPGATASGSKPAAKTMAVRPSAVGSLLILLGRQFAILRSDWKNFAILLGQPLVIAGLVSWVSNDASLELFFAYIATLWFGCSNAAQEIVKEIPIYRRERIVGISRHAYLVSKFVFLGAITALQALILYLGLQIGEQGLDGSIAWQVASLLGIALASVGIGSAISALAQTLMQAVMIVPLLLIPLILFSGHPVPANEMKPLVATISQLMPTFASQTMMDASFLWQRRLDHESLGDHWTSFRNLNRAKDLKTGETYARIRPGVVAILTQLIWAAIAYFAAAMALRSREES